MKNFVVGEKDVKKRLDVFVAEKMPQLSRAFIQKLCDMGKVKINGSLESSKKQLREGDKVKIDFDPKTFNSVSKIDLPIIYEDNDSIVINKPSGLLTHSKGAFNPEPTVATFIKPKVKDMSDERAGIVHRLDRGTSGVIICAKNSEAQSWLQKQFSTRRVKKTYVAVIEGVLEPSSALIDMPIERNPRKPQTFKVGSNGRQALTEYKTLKSDDKHSLVELRPKTGRTHQIRVHLAYLGHPIVGDTLYGGAEADRLYLHALQLELTLPSRERKVFTANLPVEFNEIVK